LTFKNCSPMLYLIRISPEEFPSFCQGFLY